MNNASSRSCPASSSAASLVWLISFGDLLTLLVCFFLVLTPWSKVNFGSAPTQQLVTSVLNSDAPPGTSLANRSLGIRTFSHQLGEFPFTKSAFDEGQESRLLEVIELASREVSPTQSGTTRMIVEICGTCARTEVLRRVGGGLAERLRERLSLEVEIDGDCRAIQTRHPRVENPLGVIRIVHE